MDYGMMIGVNSAVLDTLTLYDSGDECTDVTGGWESKVVSTSSYGQIQLEKNEDNIKLIAPSGATDGVTSRGELITSDYFDVTSYKKVNFKVLVNINGTHTVNRLAFELKNRSGTVVVGKSYKAYTNVINVETLDCSSINEEVMVNVYLDADHVASNPKHFVEIYKVWLESDTTHMADVAREVEQIYTESDLVAREVTEGWVEVDLVARKFFGGLTLYEYGNEFTSITGGWDGCVTDVSGGWFWGYTSKGSKQSDHLLLEKTATSQWIVSNSTVNKIDTTGYTTLCVEAEYYTDGTTDFHYGPTPSPTLWWDSISGYKIGSSKNAERQVFRLEDILQGEYHIQVDFNLVSGTTGRLKVYKVWLE